MAEGLGLLSGLGEEKFTRSTAILTQHYKTFEVNGFLGSALGATEVVIESYTLLYLLLILEGRSVWCVTEKRASS